MATKKKTTAGKPKASGAAKDPAKLREKLMNDPDTKAIAKNLGVDLKEYVEQVVHYVTNPDEEPTFYMAEDDDLRSVGFEPPDADAIGKYLIETAAVASAADATEYTDPKKRLVSMEAQAGAQVTGKTDAKLQDELKKQLRTKRGGKS